MAGKQVAGAAEPCQEGGDSREVEQRHLGAATYSSVTAAYTGSGMTMREMEVHVREMQAAADEGEDAESYSDKEAGKIEHFPVHKCAPAERFLAPSRWEEA